MMITEYQRDDEDTEKHLDFRHLQMFDSSRQRRSGQSPVSKNEGILLKNMDEKNQLFCRRSLFRFVALCVSLPH